VLRRGSFVKSLLPKISIDFVGITDRIIEVPWGCAGSLMVKKNEFMKLGGFDHTFFMNFEDADLCWRAWMRGWKTVFVPKAKLFHRVGASSKERMRADSSFFWKKQVSYQKNYQRFVLKTMGIDMIVMTFFVLFIHIVGYCCKGKPKLSIVILKAMWLNLLELADILKERRNIMQTSVLSSKQLLRRFLNNST